MVTAHAQLNIELMTCKDCLRMRSTCLIVFVIATHRQVKQGPPVVPKLLVWFYFGRHYSNLTRQLVDNIQTMVAVVDESESS